MTPALTPALAISLISVTLSLATLLAIYVLRPGYRPGTGKGSDAGKGNGIYYVLGTDRDVSPPRVILMTSQTFSSLLEAGAYAEGCAGGWGAFVVKAVGTSHLRTPSVPR